jgi:hypothetical protein
MTQPESTPEEHHVVERAKHFLNTKLKWLSPSSSLHSAGSRDFGRSIESSLIEISKGEVKRLKLRKRDTAVVMSIDHYDEILRMKEMYSKLIERVQEKEIAEATDAYEALYQRITSDASRNAADNLFSATEEDLRATYQPGTTEAK